MSWNREALFRTLKTVAAVLLAVDGLVFVAVGVVYVAFSPSEGGTGAVSVGWGIVLGGLALLARRAPLIATVVLFLLVVLVLVPGALLAVSTDSLTGKLVFIAIAGIPALAAFVCLIAKGTEPHDDVIAPTRHG